MNWKSEWKKLVLGAAVFIACFLMPTDSTRFNRAVIEALALTRWYAQEHVLLCLVPAFFIAGAIAVFVSQTAVMKYLGPRAPKAVAYGVASVSGTVLAVCSCTVLPLFAGIWRMGAGLGPATAFLYAGPAINVLAIILTARVLGAEMGIARAIGAILFSIVIGVLMHLIFRREDHSHTDQPSPPSDESKDRPLWQNVIYFGAMVGILVFANWGRPATQTGIWYSIWAAKWTITTAFAVILALVLMRWFGLAPWKIGLVAVLSLGWYAAGFLPTHTMEEICGCTLPWSAIVPFTIAVVGLSVILAMREGEAGEWFEQTWSFAKQITPLLFIGVLIAGFLLGRPGREGVIPAAWVASLVGGNSIAANLFAAVVGAFMYFATLTEVPILEGLVGSGMGKGPALALLLAGPALSLPNMLVIHSVMGTRKTVTFVCLVIAMSTLAGLIFGVITT